MYNRFCKNYKVFCELNKGSYRAEIAKNIGYICDVKSFEMLKSKDYNKYLEVCNIIFNIEKNIKNLNRFETLSFELKGYGFYGIKSEVFDSELLFEQLKLIELLLTTHYWIDEAVWLPERNFIIMEKTKTARETAMQVLTDIEKNSSYTNISLNNHLKKSALNKADRGFVTELCLGTVRNKIYLDFIISKFSKIKIKKISAYILSILRLSVYQLSFLKNIPQSAVCDEAVKLSKRYGHMASANFVNALLRNIANNIDKVSLPNVETDFENYLSIKYSYPLWLTQKLLMDFGKDFTISFMEKTNEPQKTVLRVNSLKTNRDELIFMLKQEGIEARGGELVKDSVIIENSFGIENIKAYKNGFFTVQDQSSQAVSIVLDPKSGDSVLDMCSAPGGKATHMAELMKNQGKIVAQDIFPHKIELILKSAKRLSVNIIEARLFDATIFNKGYENSFDRVLCDVPCSGLGIIAKKPDIKYNKINEDFQSLNAIQKAILQNASKYVKIGGFLVYSTCTINKNENVDIINWFLNENKNYEASDISKYFENIKKDTEKNGYIELYPNLDNTDGFFIAKFKRLF